MVPAEKSAVSANAVGILYVFMIVFPLIYLVCILKLDWTPNVIGSLVFDNRVNGRFRATSKRIIRHRLPNLNDLGALLSKQLA
jgi:hypothetical protein